MAGVCRKSGFWGKVRKLLEAHMREAFPPDAHLICNGSVRNSAREPGRRHADVARWVLSFCGGRRLKVAVMQVFPRFQLSPVVLDHFEDREDLIAALLASSHVPLYLDSSSLAWTAFRNGLYVDGGQSVGGRKDDGCDEAISSVVALLMPCLCVS